MERQGNDSRNEEVGWNRGMESSGVCSESLTAINIKTGPQLWIRLPFLVATVLLAKALLLALAIFFLNAGALEPEQSAEDCGKEDRVDLHRATLLLLNITQDHRCQMCPQSWIWFWGHCYYFSVGRKEDRKWAASEDFCSEHNASLAIIENNREMEFILGQIRQLRPQPFLWLGLTDRQEEGQWLWHDGKSLEDHTQFEVQWNLEQRDCADLRGNGSLFATDCEAYGPWVCESPGDRWYHTATDTNLGRQ